MQRPASRIAEGKAPASGDGLLELVAVRAAWAYCNVIRAISNSMDVAGVQSFRGRVPAGRGRKRPVSVGRLSAPLRMDAGKARCLGG